MTPRPLRVAVNGYYGYGNTGDEALALAISRELRRLGHTPVILSNAPDHTARTYGVESAPRMRPVGLLRALMRADVLLSGGGSLLQDHTSARNLTYYLAVIRVARLLGKRAVVFNQGVGPLSLEGGVRVARALRGMTIIVRDQLSCETLRTLGLDARLGGDPALLLEPTPGVTRDERAVVIAPRGDVQDANDRLVRLAERLRAEGRRVIALAFMPGKDDAAARALSGEYVSTSDPQVAMDTIASAGFVIGVRLHAVILAAAAGTPFAGVSYDPKVQGFCTDAGAPYVPTSFDEDELLRAALHRAPYDNARVHAMRGRARDSFAWALQS
ncbi:polysaccharide pyruvyl transferase CsaB [Deinococcus maricopensis]|uniref:Polysaccharide pyruvyl transferase CsaB n=1 Tax=Deinococcus maricopensis (strain DSM 21211 / LMG 22137 / NRRL B-23946 / LB-34) TaxID=709986 RepID=E8U4Y4_DEIML|nr:polysaccharide pyruvyl transferase CsaB [Deinococcus maricopensis DSM 21211]